MLRTFDLRGILVAPTENEILQLFRYIFVGGTSFMIDFAAYCLLEFAGMHYLIAGIVAFLLSFSFNFTVSRVLIFQSNATKKASLRELLGVIFISVVGLGLTELLLYLGTDFLRMDFRVSKIIVSVIVLFWNYAARKLIVYRKVSVHSEK